MSDYGEDEGCGICAIDKPVASMDDGTGEIVLLCDWCARDLVGKIPTICFVWRLDPCTGKRRECKRPVIGVIDELSPKGLMPVCRMHIAPFIGGIFCAACGDDRCGCVMADGAEYTCENIGRTCE